jgi:archaellum component FlaG (FlaF/FlaG flagellin family)
MKLKLATTLLFLGAVVGLHAQNITTSTLTWSAASTMDIDQGSVESGNAGVVSYPNRIDWIGSDGTVKYSFAITNTIGTWTNVNTNGVIRFDVTASGTSGNIQFTKDNSGIYVRLILYMPDAPQITELTIKSIK